MTEFEAWEYLAAKWELPMPTADGEYEVFIFEPDTDNCLCDSVSSLMYAGKISREMREDMWTKIDTLPQDPNPCLGAFKFPLDASGAKMRAAACREFASKLNRDWGK